MRRKRCPKQTFSYPYWSLTKVGSVFARTGKHFCDKALAPSPNCSVWRMCKASQKVTKRRASRSRTNTTNTRLCIACDCSGFYIECGALKHYRGNEWYQPPGIFHCQIGLLQKSIYFLLRGGHLLCFWFCLAPTLCHYPSEHTQRR